MPTKPTDNVPEWASNANFSVGPTGIIGTPTRVATSLSTAVADGFVPWLPEAPATGQITNEWMHRGWALLDWVYQGSATASADAHIVETNSAGRAALTSAASGGTATLTSTVTGNSGTAIQGTATNSVAIRASNDSAALAALVATNADGSTGAVSCLASAIGDSDGFRAEVFDDARGVVVTFDPTIGPNARGIVCDVAGTDATGIAVNAGTGSGVGVLVEGGITGTTGISCFAASGGGNLIFCQHNGTGNAISVQTFSGATAIYVDASGGANTQGAVQVTGDGTSGPAIYAYNNVQAASSSEAIARAAITAGVGAGAGDRGIAIVGSASDPFVNLGVGVLGISAGLGSSSAGLWGDATFGEGYGAILASSLERSALRLVPAGGAYPANGLLGDVCSVNFATDANDGLAFHNGTAWLRVAHTAYRYREPAVGFTNASSFTGAGTVSLLAPATFTAADGGDVLICVDLGLSHTALTQVGITVKSDDGSGGTVTTHLSSRDVRFATTTNASTETSRQWSWRRKITPTNTGPRRYFIEIDVPGATTVYYWDVGLSVHGELTP